MSEEHQEQHGHYHHVEHSPNYIDRDVVTFGLKGTPEPIIQFPFEEIDRGNPLTSEIEEAGPEHFALAGDAFGLLLGHLWRGGASRMSAAFRRFVVVSAMVRPDLLDGLKMPELAERLGVTKQALSAIMADFRAEFGDVQFRNTRSASARESMRQARFKQVANGINTKAGREPNRKQGVLP